MSDNYRKKPCPFDPCQYLDFYFRNIDAEYQALYAFWCATVKTIDHPLLALELGVGPTIYSTIPLAPYFPEIHLADYVEDSLTQINLWLREDSRAFNWVPHIKLVLQTEGKKGTEEEVEGRAQKIRQCVSRVTTCDINLKMPLGEATRAYDLVTAHYCTEVATNNIEEWYQAIENICRMIKPGGYFLFSASLNLQIYRTYNDRNPSKPSLDITAEDVRRGFKKAGFNIQTMKMEHITAPPERPYSGSMLAFCRKV